MRSREAGERGRTNGVTINVVARRIWNPVLAIAPASRVPRACRPWAA